MCKKNLQGPWFLDTIAIDDCKSKKFYNFGSVYEMRIEISDKMIITAFNLVSLPMQDYTVYVAKSL